MAFPCRILLSLLLTSSFVCQAGTVVYHDDAVRQPWRDTDDVIPGWDWSLPPSVTPPANGFLSCSIGPKDDTFPGNRVSTVSVSWDQLEPEEGKFKFDTLARTIEDRLKRGAKGIALHVRASVWETRYFEPGDKGKPNPEFRTREGTAPRWLSGYGIVLREESPHWELGTPFQIVNMDIFSAAYHQRYVRFVEALGDSGVLAHPGLVISFVHLISSTRGEEGGAGYGSDEIVRERLEAWARAAGPHVGKMAYTAHSGPLLDYAYELGMGQRNGFVEMYLLHVDNPQLGQHMDEDGYLITDEDFPPIKEGRAWGDENEEYQPHWEARFGPVKNFPHRYRESSLRALQMRRNFLWEQGDGKTLDPHLTAYVGLTLGRNIEDTPDAWSYLRESYVRQGEKRNGPVVPVKNFERWLIQRDAPGYTTTATRRVDHGFKSPLWSSVSRTYVEDKLFDHTARKSKKIGFLIDPRFLAAAGDRIAVKVTYYDNRDWALTSYGPNGPVHKIVTTTGDDQLKTATFFLDNIRSRPTGEPYDLVIQGRDGEVEVSFVRAIRNASGSFTKK